LNLLFQRPRLSVESITFFSKSLSRYNQAQITGGFIDIAWNDDQKDLQQIEVDLNNSLNVRRQA
jgi:hypothetical protein